MSRITSVDQLPHSASSRRLNAHLLGDPGPMHTPVGLGMAKAKAHVTKPRIRQRIGPKLNKTEAAFLDHLKGTQPSATIYSQEITLHIANGCRYTPDFVTVLMDFPTDGYFWTAYEVKGPKAWDDAIVKLKVAASKFPAIRFVLVTRKGPTWTEEHVKP
jgi:hypothetical protein